MAENQLLPTARIKPVMHARILLRDDIGEASIFITCHLLHAQPVDVGPIVKRSKKYAAEADISEQCTRIIGGEDQRLVCGELEITLATPLRGHAPERGCGGWRTDIVRCLSIGRLCVVPNQSFGLR